MTPSEAHNIALQNGPSDETRAAACGAPYFAYLYALEIDQGPRDDTRAAASRDLYFQRMYETEFPVTAN